MAVDMYKLALQQAENVEKMVQLLESIKEGLVVVTENQGKIHIKLTEIEERLEIIEAQGGIDDDDDWDGCDDFFNDDEDWDDCSACDCDCEEEGLSFEELVDAANDDLHMLTSSSQLPYKFNGTTIFEFIPGKSPKPMIIVNEGKRTVVAMLKDSDGKVVRRGIARCAPDDKFSPVIGAAIAAYRLFDIPVPYYYL